MTGSEVRKVLQENRINFAWLAKELGISPQGLNSRLLAKEFRQSYLLELNQVLGIPLFEVPTAKIASTIIHSLNRSIFICILR